MTIPVKRKSERERERCAFEAAILHVYPAWNLKDDRWLRGYWDSRGQLLWEGWLLRAGRRAQRRVK